MMISTSPLTETFGVTVNGMNLSGLDDAGFEKLRALFEEHSLLLFPGQNLSDEDHIALARRFGPLEDRNSENLAAGATFKVPEVSNIREDGSVTDEMDLHTLQLKSNMQWHSDSTFLPIPALTNILAARVVTKEAGHTEFASTRAGWAAMPEELRAKIRGRGFWHHYSHSRARISAELAALPLFHKWPAQYWKAVWKNPVNGKEALYIASHAYQIDDMDKAESQELIDELMAFVTQPQFVYSHKWSVGDVLIWDQRAVLHRATPWNYKEPRKLSSICVSATTADGVDAMRSIV